jgi:hypothetical protein
MVPAAGFLALDAWARTADGDARVALEDVAALLGMARHAPSLTLHNERHALLALRDVLAATTPRPEDLARVSLIDDAASLRQFEQEEAAFALFGLAAISSDPPLPWNHWYDHFSRWTRLPRGLVAPVGNTVVLPAWRVFLVPDDLETYRRILERHQRLVQVPHEQPYHDWGEVRRAVAARPGGAFTLMFLRPRLQGFASGSSNVATLRELARVAIALEQYRAKHGKYPDRLDELVPEQLPRIPRDPRNGQPFRLVRGTGVELSSSADTELARGAGRDELTFRLR